MTCMKGVEKEHCKVSITKLALGNPLLCHSGLDAEFSVWISGFLLEFTLYLIRGRNDTL